MEFFAIAQAGLDEQAIQEQVTGACMEADCDSIFILNTDGEVGEIGKVWGKFRVQRQIIRGGVRFSLLTCPSALAWAYHQRLPTNAGWRRCSWNDQSYRIER